MKTLKGYWPHAVTALLALGVAVWSIWFAEDEGPGERIASWVQGLGGLLAVYAAFRVGHQQMETEKQSAARASEESAKRLRDVIKAVVDDVHQQVINVRSVFAHEPESGEEWSKTRVPFFFLGLNFDAKTYRIATARLESVPIFNLDSGELASLLIGFQHQARRLEHWIATADRLSRPFEILSDEEKEIPVWAVRDNCRETIDTIGLYYRKLVEFTGGTPIQEPRDAWWSGHMPWQV